MLKQRVLVAVVLLPIGIALIFAGGLAYLVMVAFFMVVAAGEYAQMFAALNRRSHRLLVAGGALTLLLSRYFWGFRYDVHLIAALILLTLVYHMADYERGAAESGTDFAVSLSGMLYIGFIGAYMISLRQLADGAWWVMLALPVIWIADSGAYFAGRAWGKHKISPRLSPRKTWEGYLAGVAAGTLSGAALAAAFPLLAGHAVAGMSPVNGALVGFLISTFAPLGDLAESMFKRQAGVKDSGNLLPGHGGAFDRVDSWLWAGLIAYYFVTLVT